VSESATPAPTFAVPAPLPQAVDFLGGHLTADGGLTRLSEAETWIKDPNAGCFADRLSCHRFCANQFRLLLLAAAYWLLGTLRRWLGHAGVARVQLATLRLRLIKVCGGVKWHQDHVRWLLSDGDTLSDEALE